MIQLSIYCILQGFIESATVLLSDSCKYKSICEAGQKYVTEKHSSEKESEAYVSLVEKLSDVYVDGLIASSKQSCNNNNEEDRKVRK